MITTEGSPNPLFGFLNDVFTNVGKTVENTVVSLVDTAGSVVDGVGKSIGGTFGHW